MSMLEAARRYIDEGYHLFPSSKTKLPLVKWSTETTVDLAVVDEWIERWPSMMLCASCGPSGIVVLDLDVRKEPRGDVWLMEQIRDRGPIPWTRQSITGSLGLHFTFRDPTNGFIRNTQTKIHPSVDVRGNGGMVVLAPSVSKAGPYEEVGDGAPLAAVSGWLLDLMVETSRAEEEASKPPSAHLGHYRQLDNRLDRALKYVDKMPEAISGSGGHVATWRVACVCVHRFVLPDEASIEVLRYYSRKCSPPWSDRELNHKLVQAKQNATTYAAAGALR